MNVRSVISLSAYFSMMTLIVACSDGDNPTATNDNKSTVNTVSEAPAPATPTPPPPEPSPDDSEDRDIAYNTYGVHNDKHDDLCEDPDTCVYVRGEGEPANPLYPEYWVSDWNMYRVYNNYEDNPPPYQGQPPADLKKDEDYQVSQGTSYYDSTWTDPTTGEQEGAMMEHYEEFCLPIFPIPNNYTCSFVSLGDTAFFITYDQDRPEGMPPVCLFSKFNHPPERDFIEHLPYDKGDSERIGEGGQGYSFWVSADDGSVMQHGASPDLTSQGGILFGYGFQKTGDNVMPQSFYFSGYPIEPANAPIVSQNYTNFRVEKPDPATTWDQVSNLNPADLPMCQLFNPPEEEGDTLTATKVKRAPTWADIGRGRATQQPAEQVLR